MDRSRNSLERVRNLLAAMDRSIDQARNRRLRSDDDPPASSAPTPSLELPSEPASQAGPSRPKARRMDPSRSRFEGGGASRQAI